MRQHRVLQWPLRVNRRRLVRSERFHSKGSSIDKWMHVMTREVSVETLPALKVLAESLRLLRQSPAVRCWNASDWLVGLSVLIQYKTKHRVTNLHDDKHKKAFVMDQVLLAKLLRYVRVCDAIYASSITGFCQEANIQSDCVLRAHSGGVVSPKCVIVADHKHREILLVVRGTASLLDFCTDLCLHNEPFQNGQGHRGMVHASNWLVHHLGSDLKGLSEKYSDYRLVITGHSLGAAVAALTAMQLRNEFPTIRCYTFGTPACVTQNLAISSYDFITTVVNGYDCVPRLHQHSLMRLQEEIRCFDWRTTLKQMVAEEIHKQKVAVEKQQRAKLEELQATLQKELLQVKERTHKATAKLGEVKRVASTNIMEFAHDVDALVANKLSTAFSVLKTEHLSLEYVSFIKKLLKVEDIEKDNSFWWKCMTESIAALERLSSAVKKPEELEHVLIELKAVLQKTSISSRKLLNIGDDHTECTRLQLFRSRVDDIIDKTRASLKTRIGDQVSKVSTTVSSNVKGYVGTIKEETEALGTMAQEELDQVVDTIYRSVPLFFAWNRENNASDDQSSFTHGKESRCDEVVVDHDFSEQSKGKTGKRSAQDLKQNQMQGEKDNGLQHDPLFPPGQIIYLNRVGTSEPLPQSVATDDSTKKDVVEFVEVATDEFSRVVLSNRMLLDHFCPDYEQVLQCQAKLLQSPPDSTKTVR